MMERLSMRHLRTLCILRETGSMRQTAETIGRSQPAISLQIKDLEQIVGFPLLFHRRGAIVFTSKGEELANFAHQFMGQITKRIEALRGQSNSPLCFAVTHDIFDSCRYEVDNFTEYGISLLPMTSGDITRSLASGTIDAGIIKTATPSGDAALSWSCGLAWAGSAGQCARTSPLQLILLDSGCFYHHLALTLFKDAPPSSVDLVICDDWTQVAGYLREGGVTIISSTWAEMLDNEHAPLNLPRLPHVALNLMHRPIMNDPAMDWGVSRLSSIVNTSISGQDNTLGPAWQCSNIRVLSI